MDAPNLWIGVGDFGRLVLEEIVGAVDGSTIGRAGLLDSLQNVRAIPPEHRPLLGFYPAGREPGGMAESIFTIDEAEPRASLARGVGRILHPMALKGNVRDEGYMTIFVHARDLAALLEKHGPNHWLFDSAEELGFIQFHALIITDFTPVTYGLQRTEAREKYAKALESLVKALHGRSDGVSRTGVAVLEPDRTSASAPDMAAEQCALLFELAQSLDGPKWGPPDPLYELYDSMGDAGSTQAEDIVHVRSFAVRSCGIDALQFLEVEASEREHGVWRDLRERSEHPISIQPIAPIQVLVEVDGTGEPLVGESSRSAPLEPLRESGDEDQAAWDLQDPLEQSRDAIGRLATRWRSATAAVAGEISTFAEEPDLKLRNVRGTLLQAWRNGATWGELAEAVRHPTASLERDTRPVIDHARTVPDFPRGELMDSIADVTDALDEVSDIRDVMAMGAIFGVPVFFVTLVMVAWVFPEGGWEAWLAAAGIAVGAVVVVVASLWIVAISRPRRHAQDLFNDFREHMEEIEEDLTKLRVSVQTLARRHHEERLVAEYDRALSGLRTRLREYERVAKLARPDAADVRRGHERVFERLLKVSEAANGHRPKWDPTLFRSEHAPTELVQDSEASKALRPGSLERTVAAFVRDSVMRNLSEPGLPEMGADGVSEWLSDSRPLAPRSSWLHRGIYASAERLEGLFEESQQRHKIRDLEHHQREIPRQDKAFSLDTGEFPEPAGGR